MQFLDEFFKAGAFGLAEFTSDLVVLGLVSLARCVGSFCLAIAYSSYRLSISASSSGVQKNRNLPVGAVPLSHTVLL